MLGRRLVQLRDDSEQHQVNGHRGHDEAANPPRPALVVREQDAEPATLRFRWRGGAHDRQVALPCPLLTRGYDHGLLTFLTMPKVLAPAPLTMSMS